MEGDYKSTITEGEKILANQGDNSNLDELYYILGLSYLKDGNYLRASDIFEIILNEFKGSAFRDEAKLGLGDAYFLRGDYDKAEACYKELIDTNPLTKLSAQVYHRLSECAIKKGNTEEAKSCLDKLKSFPLGLEAKVNQDLAKANLYYTVQVGAFSKSLNATNFMRHLIQKGYPAYLEELTTQDKTTYRVRIGRFSSREEAVALANKLTQEGFSTKIFP